MAETTGLLNRRTGYSVPRVRISSSPLKTADRSIGMIDRFGSANGRSPAGLQGFVFLRAMLRLFLAGASGGACGRSGTQPVGCTLEADLRDARVAGLRLTEAAGCGGIAEAENSLCKIRFGPKLAKRPHERTCGREERAFAGAKLRPVAPFRAQFIIQSSELPIGAQPAKDGTSGCELRAFAAPRLRPANRSAIDSCCKTSPQPSGRACDVEEQPFARGRLRAAGRCATEMTLQPADLK